MTTKPSAARADAAATKGDTPLVVDVEEVPDEEASESARFARAHAREAHYPIRLLSLEHVRVEIARVYREARQGRLDSKEAARLVWVLAQLRDVVEAIRNTEYLDRIVAMEERLKLTKGDLP